MSEAPKHETPQGVNLPSDNDKVTAPIHFLRHSKASYQSYAEVLSSETPNRPIDPEKQLLPDIPEVGVEFANQAAQEFLSQLDPAQDALFFVSSSQSRALETAKIYKDVAREKGFTVIAPEHHRNPLAERMEETDVRVVDALSLKSDSSLWSAVYNPPAYLAPIKWDAIDPETKATWEKAREQVLASDAGNWGANFAHHSDSLKKEGLLPADQNTATELFKKQFPQILRLARFGAKKAAAGFEGKRVQIVAVGHENYLAKAFEEYFGEEGINNCEVIAIDPHETSTKITRRGHTVTLPN